MKQTHDVIATPWHQMQPTKNTVGVCHGKQLGCSVTRPFLSLWDHYCQCIKLYSNIEVKGLVYERPWFWWQVKSRASAVKFLHSRSSFLATFSTSGCSASSLIPSGLQATLHFLVKPLELKLSLPLCCNPWGHHTICTFLKGQMASCNMFSNWYGKCHSAS